MFMRLVQVKIDPEKISEFKKAYEDSIIPKLQQSPGCVYAGLVQSVEDPNDGISVTLWRDRMDASAYERGGMYARALDEARPFFSEALEWEVQLSVDLRREFWPVPAEPVVKSFDTDVSPLRATGLPTGKSGPAYIRIFSIKVKPERKAEFAEIYHREIIPGLRQVRGCLDAYLSEGGKERNELLSITVWSGLDDARAYEATGKFDLLKRKVEHTFSGATRLTMAHSGVPPSARGESAGEAMKRSDPSVRTYSLVVGKTFN